ncbi:MAG: type II toxin-antitoxin system RelB/DinJ family antitoxin [Desulfovibrio sp.]|jgi:antitoxin component of RelBE/YafQ-DinJ toxin-antitoxin module|nr:type II toxin-antitoxin system RelB/DinJ family antitoxin [Desulfovibrio sp.]
MLTVEIDPNIEVKADAVLHNLGLSLQDAVRITLEHIVESGQFPLWNEVTKSGEPAHSVYEDSPENHPAFGMWADREDMTDPSAWIRKQRSARRRHLYGAADAV